MNCDNCIHNDVCHSVAECLIYIPGFTCDNYEPQRPTGEWDFDKYIRLYKEKEQFYKSQGAEVTAREMKFVAELLEKIGNVSSVERPTGEWIMEENNKDYPEGRATCSHCGYKMDVKRWEWLSAVRWYLKPNYCPECGADMKR